MRYSAELIPSEVMSMLVERVKAHRKRHKISQQKLAERSGVSFGSIKRFETSGEISLVSLLKIAQVLNCLEDFQQLFSLENNQEDIKKLFSDNPQ